MYASDVIGARIPNMRIPSPNPNRKYYESEAFQESIAFGLTFIGLAAQIVVGIIDRFKPDVAQRLAAALYGPDRDLKLSSLAFSHSSSTPSWPTILGWCLSSVGIVLLFYFRFKRAKQKDLAEAQLKSPEGLRGSVYVLYALAKKYLNIEEDDGTVRVTLYGVTEPRRDEVEELEQVIAYVGSSRSKIGRRYPVTVGLIGLAVRTGEPQIGQRTADNDDDYRKELIHQWGFTKEMAAEITIDRRSFIAIPIKGEADEVIGVVYADSNLNGAFDLFIEELIAATYGVAAYIRERY